MIVVPTNADVPFARDEAPLVSVTIPSYNYAHLIHETLDSVLAQDYPNMEVLVGDDGSTDDTPKLMERYVKEHGDRVRYLRLEHAGLGATRNRLTAAAKGEYLALVDSDDLWLPGKLTKQMRYMLANPKAGLCHTALDFFGMPGLKPWVVTDPAKQHTGYCFEKEYWGNDVMVPTVVLRKSMMPGEGFYLDLRGVEDYAMWIEMCYFHPFIYIPEILAKYRKHAKQMTADGTDRTKVICGLARLRFLDKHRPRFKPDEWESLRKRTLKRLEEDAYDRYWRGDWKMAKLGFGYLEQYGHKVKWKHKTRASLQAALVKR